MASLAMPCAAAVLRKGPVPIPAADTDQLAVCISQQAQVPAVADHLIHAWHD